MANRSIDYGTADRSIDYDMAEQSNVGANDALSSLFSLPNEMRFEIVRRLPVTSFRAFSSTCQELHQLWNEDYLWKLFLKRDFGRDSVSEANRSTCPSKYKDRYFYQHLRKKQERRLHRRMVFLRCGHVPPIQNAMVSSTRCFPYPMLGAFPGVIRGNDDPNPFGYPPGGQWPRPRHQPPPFFPPHPFQPCIGPCRPGGYWPGGPFGGGSRFS